MTPEGVSGGKNQSESNADVGNVFSPPRVTKIVESLGLSAEFALDLADTDSQGMMWDLSVREVQSRTLQ